MLRLGGPVFTKSEDPVELVRLHREMGFSAAFLPPVRDAARRHDVIAAFAQANIIISEIGAYGLNVLDTDEAVRERNIEAIKERLRFADETGALCCIMQGGTVQAGGWGTPSAENFSKEAFDTTVAAIRAILDDVKPRAAKLVLETSAHRLPDGPEEYLELLKAVDRPAFGVHFDPANLASSPRRCLRNGDFLRHCFALIGPHIICAHAKDAVLSKAASVHIDECPAGQGQLDYHTYLQELAKCKQAPVVPVKGVSRTLIMDLQAFYAKQSPPLMLEHLANAAETKRARDFLFRVAKDVDVEFIHSALATA
ncbi:MAG: sugar phosphate isomerase/epimerase [Verrucomicrobia bacterium]|nr:sugar phosphate isomerase/epimerase [Verrucomicrobiota bacterium]